MAEQFLALNVPAADLRVPLGWALSPASVTALNERVDEIARRDDVRSFLLLLNDGQGRPSQVASAHCDQGVDAMAPSSETR